MFNKKDHSVNKLQNLSLAVIMVLLSSQMGYAIEIDPKRCEEASKACEKNPEAAWRNYDWFGEEAEYFVTLAMQKETCEAIKKECLKIAVTHEPKHEPKGK